MRGRIKTVKIFPFEVYLYQSDLPINGKYYYFGKVKSHGGESWTKFSCLTLKTAKKKYTELLYSYLKLIPAEGFWDE